MLKSNRKPPADGGRRPPAPLAPRVPRKNIASITLAQRVTADEN